MAAEPVGVPEMSRVSSNTRDITPAQRGQIIQHVLVDGWSPTQVAAAYDISERDVERWVAVYRRHGMASLRSESAADGPPRRWKRRLRAFVARVSVVLYGDPGARAARCIVLRRGADEGDPRPDRRSLWN
jgi:transposase-like protein